MKTAPFCIGISSYLPLLLLPCRVQQPLPLPLLLLLHVVALLQGSPKLVRIGRGHLEERQYMRSQAHKTTFSGGAAAHYTHGVQQPTTGKYCCYYLVGLPWFSNSTSVSPTLCLLPASPCPKDSVSQSSSVITTRSSSSSFGLARPSAVVRTFSNRPGGPKKIFFRPA